jgi:hypothetical protein
MEAREVSEDRQGGLPLFGFAYHAFHGATQRGKMLQDFGDPNDCHFGIVGDDFDAGGAHLRSAHTKYLNVQALTQRLGEARGIHVARRFAGG